MTTSRLLRVLLSAVFIASLSCGLLFAEGAPKHWQVIGPAPSLYLVRADSDDPRTGRRSVTVKTETEDMATFGALAQTFRADRYRGKRLRLSAFLRSARLELWAGLWMRIDGTTMSSLALDNMHDRPVTGTTPWTRYEVVLDVPEDSARILFGVMLAGKGQIWADDFALEVVGTDVEVTDLRPEPAPLQIESTVDLPDHPLNLGFEE